jgi:hypothetical protein
MSRNSDQVCKDIQRIANQKYTNSFDQCMSIWQIFKKGIFGKELKEEFPKEYDIVFNLFKEIGADNIQLSTLTFLNSFIKTGKLHTISDEIIEYILGQSFKEPIAKRIILASEKLHIKEKQAFIEQSELQGKEHIYDYSKSIFLGMNIPIVIECKRCNSQLTQTPSAHLSSKYPCINCAMNHETWEPSEEKKTEHWSHVFNGLYISDIYGAQNTMWIQNNGFTGIVDLSNSPHPQKFDKHIEVLRIAVDDNAHNDIKRHFAKCFQFIDAQLSQSKVHAKKNKILVFCKAGMSRSATIVISYLMKTFSMTTEEATTFLKKKRPLIQPNNGFLKQLKEYETELLNTTTNT